MALGQTFAALLPWYGRPSLTKVDPGTDIYCTCTLVQTFYAFVPQDRHSWTYAHSTERPEDRYFTDMNPLGHGPSYTHST